MSEISRSLLEILFLLSDNIPTSNAKIGRILRRHSSATSRDLKNLKNDELVEQNSEQEYIITGKGLDLLEDSKYQKTYQQELKKYVKKLKERPELKGWNIIQLNLGGLTHAETEMLYMFKDNDYFNNAQIKRILRRHEASTYNDLQKLVSKGLLSKNSEGEYSLTSTGHDLIQRNVSRNVRCEITRNFISQLKKKPERRGLWAMIVAAFASLGLIKTNSAHAVTSTGIISTPSSVAPVIVPSVIVTPVTATTSLLTTKTILASIVAAMLVTGGAYVTEPELFGLNQNLDGISKVIPSDISSNKISATDAISQYNTSSDNGDKSSFSSDTSGSAASPSGAVAPSSQGISQPRDISTESIPVQTESPDAPNAISHGSGPSVTSTQETSSSPRNFDNPVFSVFADGIGTSEITFDSNGNMYAANQETHSIQVYDSSGSIIDTIGKSSIIPVSFEIPGFERMSKLSSLFIQYAHAVEEILYCQISTGEGCVDPDGIGPLKFGDGQFRLPWGIAIDSDDNIYVTDGNNDRIQKFDSDGNFVAKFGTTGSGDGQFNHPRGIAIDSDDNIYVTDGNNYRIQIFDSDGNFITKFGEKGYLSGQFDFIQSIALDSNDHLYVVDGNNYRIQIFDSDGNFITKFGERGSGDGQFFSPRDIALDSNDNIYFFDGKNTIKIFDSDGNFITKLVAGDGQFSNSRGLALDSNDNIYFLDQDYNRIQKISFEDAIVTFSEQFDEVKCDTDSMINNPISVPSEIAVSLPLAKLLPKANNFAETEQFEESLLFYYVASQIEPDSSHAWNGIGYSQTFLCDNNSPIDSYSNTLSMDDSNINALNGLGFFYANQAQLQFHKNAPHDLVESTSNRAIVNYEKALQLDANNINALNGIGTVHIILEQYNAAIKLFEESLEINPNKISTTNGMAFAHLRSGNLVSSITFYERTLSEDKNNFDALSGLLSIYIQQDKQNKVNEIIYKLGQFQDKIVESLIVEGKWFAERGSVEEAKLFFKKALELDPGNKQAQNLLDNTYPEINKQK